MRVLRVLSFATIGLALVTYSIPWALYAFSLAQIEGRPVPPQAASLSADDLSELGRRYRIEGAPNVTPLSPWIYLKALLTSDLKDLAERGTAMAWAVARQHNGTHLSDRFYWHPSGAALTIWITRSWTQEQIMSAALRIDRDAEAARAESRRGATQQAIQGDGPASGGSAP